MDMSILLYLRILITLSLVILSTSFTSKKFSHPKVFSFHLSLAKNAEIGGIYQFTGSSNGPPPELKKLLGLKDKPEKSAGKKPSRMSTPAKTQTTNKSSTKPKGKAQKGESVDDLERQVISKYGSSGYQISKIQDWDDDDDDRKSQVKRERFEGFDVSHKKTSPSPPTVMKSSESNVDVESIPSKDTQVNNIISTGNVETENIDTESGKTSSGVRLFKKLLQRPTPTGDSKPDDSKPTRTTMTTTSVAEPLQDSIDDMFDMSAFGEVEEDEEPRAFAKFDKRLNVGKSPHQLQVEEEEVSKPTYRLRAPIPISPAEEKRLADKAIERAAADTAKETAKAERMKESKKLEAAEFFPFDFKLSGQDTTSEDTIFSTNTFEDIGITDPVVLANLERMGLFHPTKIQEAAVPKLLSCLPILMQAQTGSGKTLAFLLPLLNVIDPTVNKVQALIFAPSRELVCQIALVGEKLFEGTGIRILPIIGGTNVRHQVDRLRDDRPQVLVATPGRLAELVFRLEKLRLGMVRAVVIDEVDNLLREPYVGELQTILEATPLFKRSGRLTPLPSPSQSVPKEVDNDNTNSSTEDEDDVLSQSEEGSGELLEDLVMEQQQSPEKAAKKRLICFSSATGNDAPVYRFADDLCGKGDTAWSTVSAGASAMLPSTITHALISISQMKALDMLKRILASKPAVGSALIFVNDPHRVEIVCNKLLEMGLVAAPLHGDSSKDDRKEILARLRDGRLTLVVTTELAARGLDIPELTHVINFELPTDAQHYVHRAGRCGRAGRPGLVLNFATPSTKFVIRRFGKQLKVKVLDCELRNGQIFLKQI